MCTSILTAGAVSGVAADLSALTQPQELETASVLCGQLQLLCLTQCKPHLHHTAAANMNGMVMLCLAAAVQK